MPSDAVTASDVSHSDHHHDHAGHDAHAGHAGHADRFRRLFWYMLALSIPVITLSPMFADLIGYSLPESPFIEAISPVLGTVMFVWGGSPFLAGALRETRSRKPGMMMLISLAITVAYAASLGASLGVLDHHLDFWWELALLIVIMLLGHWLEMRGIAHASSALDALAALLPDQAEREVPGGTELVPPAELRVGDTVLVRPGGSIPADGTISHGDADIDESFLTGESRPVARAAGDPVSAGGVLVSDPIRITVTAIGENTTLAGIGRLIAAAQNSSSSAQRLADRAAAWLFWFALIAAAVTAVVWSAIGLPDEAVVRTITVLVIACPHALGLAIPLVVSIATERAARAGILIAHRIALETSRNLNAVLFDKTGTLTRGEPAVVAAHISDRVLALAAATESWSEHPLAHAVVRYAGERGVSVPPVASVRQRTGIGMCAEVEGHRVCVGGPALLEAEGIAPEALAGEGFSAESLGWGAVTVLHVIVDGAVDGAMGLADPIRPESRAAVAALRARGVRTVMVTGDADIVAADIAAQLGIDEVHAGMKPESKAALVSSIPGTVAMVGDGVNDAPALASADVGIAIGAGTDVAIASAGIILTGSDPRSVVTIMDLAQASYRKMKQNLAWAAGYNLVSVPLAAGVLAPIGFVMPMWLAAVLMSLSTIIVTINASTLRRLKL